jgi:hypothetical protein
LEGLNVLKFPFRAVTPLLATERLAAGPIMPNVICVDYSAGMGGPLVAYSFDPERAREGEFTSAE